VTIQGAGSGGQLGAHRGREQHPRRLLHHQPHLAGQFRHRSPPDRPSQHPHHAALAAQQTVAVPEQGGFTGPVGAQQGHDLAGRAGQAGLAQHRSPVAFAPHQIPLQHRFREKSRRGGRERGHRFGRFQTPDSNLAGQNLARRTVRHQSALMQHQHPAGHIRNLAQAMLGDDQSDAGGAQAV
jgi:hypothetical protein